MSSHRPSIALFIPTFHSQDTLIPVLDAIADKTLREIDKMFIIDNQSADETVTRATLWAKTHTEIAVDIYVNRENYLLGGSTQIAFKKAIEEGFSYLICLHSDGQADPKDLELFLSAIHDNKYDFILGSRMLKESRCSEYSKIRLIANRVFAYFQSRILKQCVYDLGAFVAFNLDTLQTLPYRNVAPDMAYHPNLIITSARVRKEPLRFKEFPISWGKVTTSHVNPLGYGLKHALRLMRLYFLKPRLEVDFTAGQESILHFRSNR